jgi:ATP-binding cassette subfamily F protein 3
VTLEAGNRVLVTGVTFTLAAGDRLALVGRNGSGKTTLLRVVAGASPATGTLEVAPGAQVGWLRQDPEWPDGTVRDVARSGLAGLDRQAARMQRLLDDGGEAALHEWAELEDDYRRRGGYDREGRLRRSLGALGLADRMGQPWRRLSGGERTRLALAEVLLSAPEILLLDEPTNHLDLTMRRWLERRLLEYPGAIILVSHDRDLLDSVGERTLFLANGRAELYPGRFKEAVDRRRRARDAAEARALALLVEARRLAGIAAQAKAWAHSSQKHARRARQAASRADAAREAASTARAETGSEREGPSTRVATIPSGQMVLEARALTRRLGAGTPAERVLFADLELVLRSGDRLGLVGPNGAGKTTLLAMLTGRQRSDDPAGFVRLGARVRMAYYSQTFEDLERPAGGGQDPPGPASDEGAVTPLELVREGLGRTAAATRLGGALLDWEHMNHPVSRLSGGERSRLALLLATLEPSNLLILDEPTNHLDLESIEALEEALQEYKGTLLVVSHDRAFLRNLGLQIRLLDGGAISEVRGGVDEIPEALPAGDGGPPPAGPEGRGGARAGPAFSASRTRGRLEEIDRRLVVLNSEHDRLAGELADPPPGAGPQWYRERTELLDEQRREQARLAEEWVELAGALEERP